MDHQPPDGLGARLRTARNARGWTITELADRTGLSKSFLSMVERDLRTLSQRAHLHAVADALEVSLSELTGQAEQGRRANVAAYATVPSLRVAIVDSSLADPPDAPAPPVETARADIATVLALRSRCDWLETGRRLPLLLDQLTAGAAVDGPHRAEYLRMLVMATRAAGDTVKDLGFGDLFLLASQRCMEAARALDEPAYTGVAQMQYAVALIGAKARTKSLAVARRGADELQPAASSDRLAGEMYGMLRLSAALSYAIAGDRASAQDYLTEAAQTAERLGETMAAPVNLGMGFGPTNVMFWRTSIALEFGDPAEAVAIARDVVPARIGMTSRQSSFYADRGRALAMLRGREAEAIAAFRMAERLAPQRVHASATVRESVRVMLHRSQARAGGAGLRALASRMGVWM